MQAYGEDGEVVDLYALASSSNPWCSLPCPSACRGWRLWSKGVLWLAMCAASPLMSTVSSHTARAYHFRKAVWFFSFLFWNFMNLIITYCFDDVTKDTSLPYRVATYGEFEGIGRLKGIKTNPAPLRWPVPWRGVEALGGPVAHIVEAICQPGIDRYPVL